MYSANWYSQSEKFKSSFRIVQERIKKPILIEAGTIIPANLDAFIKACICLIAYMFSIKVVSC